MKTLFITHHKAETAKSDPYTPEHFCEIKFEHGELFKCNVSDSSMLRKFYVGFAKLTWLIMKRQLRTGGEPLFFWHHIDRQDRVRGTMLCVEPAGRSWAHLRPSTPEHTYMIHICLHFAKTLPRMTVACARSVCLTSTGPLLVFTQVSRVSCSAESEPHPSDSISSVFPSNAPK